MKNELYKKVDQVPEGVRRHFAIVLDKIVACYTNERQATQGALN